MEALALAVAAGRSVAAWARETGTPGRTAYGWTQTPEFKSLVRTHRRRLVDAGIGKLTRHVCKAVNQIAKLADQAQSEAVKLAAARAILAELIAVSNLAEVSQEIEGLKRQIEELKGMRHAFGTQQPQG
jgi:hypothetical protein